MGARHVPTVGPACLHQSLCLQFRLYHDNIRSRARKLCALAMCRLLGLPSPALLASLDGLIVCITGVWAELEGGQDDGVRVEYGLEYSWCVRVRVCHCAGHVHVGHFLGMRSIK